MPNIRSTKVLHHALCIAAGRRLRFGMLTYLTNIRSTKVLHHASCIMHHATSKQGWRLKFGMLTVLTNIRSTNVL